MKQRWDICGPIDPDIDVSLDRYLPELKVKFGQVWSVHRCDKPGCDRRWWTQGPQEPVCCCLIWC